MYPDFLKHQHPSTHRQRLKRLAPKNLEDWQISEKQEGGP